MGEAKARRKLPKLKFHRLNWLEKITVGLSLWFLFYPHPYDFLFTILLIIPIVGLILNGLRGRPSIASLVTISKNDGEDDYDIADFIDFATWILLIRVSIDYEFENYYSMILPGIIGCILVFIVLIATHKIMDSSGKSLVWSYISVILCLFVYSFSATYGMNCVYDNSEPEIFSVSVVDKHISSSRRSNTYYLKVTPWGSHRETENIRVARSQYEQTKIGSFVQVDLKKGLFNIPWYYVV
jgi:hypothetical protein